MTKLKCGVASQKYVLLTLTSATITSRVKSFHLSTKAGNSLKLLTESEKD